jgi:endo-1,3(4)-beta-glucanase
MIPIGAQSAFVRRKKFVQEEWDTYFSNGRADKVAGGWRGLLYANLALIDPKTAYKFFSAPNFDQSLLDSGASR